MSATVSTSKRHVKVVAHLRRQRERVLVDEPLTIDTLPLLQSVSPLSRAIRDGAGLPYRPLAISVYVDGKRVWSSIGRERGRARGRTDSVTSTRPEGAQVKLSVASDVYGKLAIYTSERAATARAAYALLRNDPPDEEKRDEALDAYLDCKLFGEPRPKPVKPAEYEPPVDRVYSPDPSPVPVSPTIPAEPDYERATWQARYAWREREEWLRAAEGYRRGTRSLAELRALFE